MASSEVAQTFRHDMGGGGHPESFAALLAGGLGLLAKPKLDEDATMAGREVAAWRVARALGWSDLVAATVSRELMSPIRDFEVEASVQIIWAMNTVGGPPDQFSEEDTWRAAVFDALIRHTDRHGNNYLAVPRDATLGPQRLKLVDHGHAFDLQRPLAESVCTFYWPRRGEQIPSVYLDAVRGLQGDPPKDLRNLLSGDECDAFDERVETLLAGTLDIGP